MAQLAISLAGAALGNFLIPAGIPALGLTGAGIGFAVGSIVGGQLLAPEPPPLVGPKLEDGKVTTSTYGAMLPKVWGTIDVAGNIIDAGELVTESQTTTQSAKGGPKQSSTTYTQYMDYAVALCDGCDNIVKIFANEQLIFDATPGANAVRPEWLDFTLYTGTETQDPDPTFEATRGAGQVPGYRGTAYVVFRRFRVTDFGTTAINFRFVVTTNGTGSVGTTTYDQGGTGFTPSIIHNTYTDLMIGSVNRQIVVGGTEQMLVAIDPYSSTEAWRAFIYDADTYGEAFWVTQCAFPNVSSVGIRSYPDNSIIAVQHRQNVGAPSNRFLRFFYAESGLEIGRAAISTGESSFKIVSCYRDDAVFYQLRSIGSPASMSARRHTVGSTMAVVTQTLDPPTGYDFRGEETNAMWVKAGSKFFDQPAVVLVALENTSTSAVGLGVFIDLDQGQGASTAAVSWYTVDELSSGIEPYDAVYDPAEDCFFVLCNTNPGGNVVVARVSIAGVIESETNWSTAFGISGGSESIALDTAADRLWVVIGGVAYAWPTYDATATPVGYGSSLQAQALAWHPYSGSLFAGRRSDVVDDIYYQYRLGLITGGGETLQTVMQDICDDAGTNLQTGDRDCSALSAITVDGFRINRVAQRRAAIDVLRTAYLFDFVPRQGVLTAVLRGGSSSATLDDGDIGAHIAGSGSPPALEISRQSEDALPMTVGVGFIDADQNYEPGYERATRLASSGGTESRSDLAVVLSHDDAAQLSSILLHAAHVEAETYETACMPSLRSTVVPAAVVTVDYGGNTYPMRVESANIVEGGVVQLRGLRYDASVYEDFSVGGTTRDRSRSIASIGPTQLIALDIPALRDADLQAGFYVAGSTYSPGWNGAQVYRSTDGVDFTPVQVLSTEATTGFVTSPLGDGAETDMSGTLSVRLVSGALASTTNALWLAGSDNYAAVGAPGRWEIIKFRDASESDGVYTLSVIARGLADTINAKGAGQVGDRFVLLDSNALRFLTISQAEIGTAAYFKAVTLDRSVESAVAQAVTPTGATLEPYRPAALHATLSGGDWTLTWARQDRRKARFLQQPQMSESAESYSVQILDYAGTAVRTATATSKTFTYTAAMQTADFGAAVQLLRFRVAQTSSVVGTGPYVSAAFGGYSKDFEALASGRSSLIEYWALDDTSGTTCTSLSGSYNGTYTNGPALNQPSITADGAPCVRMNTSGNDDRIVFPMWSALATIQAVEFIIKPVAFSAISQEQGVVWSSTSLGGGAGWGILLTQAGNIRFVCDPTDSYTNEDTEITTSSALEIGGEYHVAVNFGDTAGDAVEIWVNGSLWGSGLVATNVAYPTSGHFRLAGRGQHLQSYVAKLAIYDTPLTQADIAESVLRGFGL